jgi:hypothetical protein
MEVNRAAPRVYGTPQNAGLGELLGRDTELLSQLVAEGVGVHRFVEPELELDFFWQILARQGRPGLA